MGSIVSIAMSYIYFKKNTKNVKKDSDDFVSKKNGDYFSMRDELDSTQKH
jgi:hypothetical protein